MVGGKCGNRGAKSDEHKPRGETRGERRQKKKKEVQTGCSGQAGPAIVKPKQAGKLRRHKTTIQQRPANRPEEAVNNRVVVKRGVKEG